MRLTVAALFGFFLLFTLFPILFRAPLLVIPVVFALAVIMLYSGKVTLWLQNGNSPLRIVDILQDHRNQRL